MPPLSPTSRRILQALTPHTRAHAEQLLSLHPLLQVSSGRRTPLRNRQVGGSPNSWHLKGRAVDIVGPLFDLQKASAEAWALRLGNGCTGPEEVLLEDSGQVGQHLHVAW